MTNTEKQIEEIIDKVFQSVMSDIGMHYKVSDRLSDILSDSLSEHLPTSIAQALAEERAKVVLSVKVFQREADTFPKTMMVIPVETLPMEILALLSSLDRPLTDKE